MYLRRESVPSLYIQSISYFSFGGTIAKIGLVVLSMNYVINRLIIYDISFFIYWLCHVFILIA